MERKKRKNFKIRKTSMNRQSLKGQFNKQWSLALQNIRNSISPVFIINLRNVQSRIYSILQTFHIFNSSFAPTCRSLTFITPPKDLYKEQLQALLQILNNISIQRQMSLCFANSRMGKNNISLIGDSLKKKEHLSKIRLDLSWGQIGKQQLKILFNKFNPKQLKSFSLNLNSNQLQRQGIKCISQSILNSVVFLQLELRLNNLKDKGALNLANLLQNRAQIKYLFINVEWNSIDNQGIIALSQLLNTLNLTSFHLNAKNNLITEQGIMSLASSLQLCPNLQSLSLQFYNNKCSGQNFQVLIDCLQNKKRLMQLYLFFQCCQISQNRKIYNFSSEHRMNLMKQLLVKMEIRKLCKMKVVQQIRGLKELCFGKYDCINLLKKRVLKYFI